MSTSKITIQDREHVFFVFIFSINDNDEIIVDHMALIQNGQ